MWSGEGNVAAASGAGLTLVALAMQRVAAPEGKLGQWRRVAVVALPSGQLTWAPLMTKEGGLMRLAEPPRARASRGELLALQEKLPDLLALRGVDSVVTRLKTLVEPAGGLAVRPVSEPAVGLGSPAAVRAVSLPASLEPGSQPKPGPVTERRATRASAAPAKPAASPAPSVASTAGSYDGPLFKPDLYGARQDVLGKLTKEQLHFNLDERAIAYPASAGHARCP